MNARSSGDGGTLVNEFEDRLSSLDDIVAWLSRRNTKLVSPIERRRVGDGQSNVTERLRDSTGRSVIVRSAPPGDASTGAHDLHREAAILTSVHPLGVPVPRVLATGRLGDGRPFYVMSDEPGRALSTVEDADLVPRADRRALGLTIVDQLAAIHAIDVASTPLADLARPGSHLSRQIRTWTKVWNALPGREDSSGVWNMVRELLVANGPAAQAVCLSHGDYRLPNLLVADSQLTAVLDWELASIGDPLVDFAGLLNDMRSTALPEICMPNPSAAGGFPDHAELERAYVAATSFDLSDLDYYRGFCSWRIATLLATVVARRNSGVLGSHGSFDTSEVQVSIDLLLDEALTLLRS